MKSIRTWFAPTAIAITLLVSGCGTVGEFILRAARDGAKQAIQSTTSQAVEQVLTGLTPAAPAALLADPVGGSGS